MQILMVNLERGWRGGERQTLLTATELQQRGYHVTVLARKGEALFKRAAEAGLRVKGVGGNGGLFFFLLCHRKAFDVVHVQTAGALTVVAAMKSWLQARLVYTRRTSFEVKAAKAARTLAKWKRVDKFVAISHAAAQAPISMGLEVSIIPSAVEFVPPDPDQIIAFSEEQHLAGKFVIATCAAFTAEKDPLTTIRAVHELWQQRQDFVFLHFGAGGSELAAAQQLIQELGLEQVYNIVGFRRDIENMYRLMHVFVLTSKQEALGSSILDAFLYEAAVVATRAGGIPELLDDGRGILCDVGDAEAIATACNQLLEDESLCREMVAKAEAWVVEQHAIPLMVDRYCDLYEHERQS
ncbi:glycosyltransferase family 4 protein [Paenalcaligenes sp. Me52]|uniref:glycosyltransferase family 4 protein n=1 Tax=Paenalcaligenes sp. Me52 TaxID=3392038 RepID=UPI003D2D2D80